MDKYVYYRTVTTMISGLSTAHDGTTMTILLMMLLMMSFYAAPINDVKSLMCWHDCSCTSPASADA